jgi:CheY-like chemotaxis protein
MPDKSGFEVCAFVRAQANLADTPVLLVSGFVDDEVTRQAEACRAEGVVKKPFQGASLRERVMELLAARKAPAAPAPVELVVAEAVIEMPVLEMAALAPEPVRTFQAPPPTSPAPVVVSSMDMVAPAAVPSAQFDEEVRALRELIQKLESRLGEQEKGLARLEQQLRDSRESANQALAQAQDREARLAEAEKQSAELRTRLTELEPAAVSATKLLQALTEFARQVLKAGESGKP